MVKIDRNEVKLDKVRSYPTVNELLDKEYGVVGTTEREKFKDQSQAFFTAQLIEDARKNAQLTQ